MKGEIDTSFVTNQRDLFTSGMAAQIGMNAFGVWLAIKSHSDFNTGECWPGMRRISDLTSLSLGAVQKSVQILLDAKLLRILEEGRGKRSAKYIPRERLDVRIGSTVLCTIVIDYVPARLRERLAKIEKAVLEGVDDPEVFAQVDIIPGKGFVWDPASNALKGNFSARDLPALSEDPATTALLSDLQKKVMDIKNKKRSRPVDK